MGVGGELEAATVLACNHHAHETARRAFMLYPSVRNDRLRICTDYGTPRAHSVMVRCGSVARRRGTSCLPSGWAPTSPVVVAAVAVVAAAVVAAARLREDTDPLCRG